MSWARLDDGFHDHPKVIGVDLSAIGLFTVCLTWSCKQGTDGFVPTHVAERLSDHTPSFVSELLRTGLFEERDGGYYIHDFLDYNPPSKAREVKRKLAKQRMRALRERSREQKENTSEPLTPVPRGRDGTGTGRELVVLSKRTGGSAEGGFDAFWVLYPKKVGKAEARKAWARAHPTPELEARMRATLEWQVRSPRWLEEGGRYVPNPATWLNQGRWDDEPTHQRYVAPRTMQNAQVAADWLGKA